MAAFLRGSAPTRTARPLLLSLLLLATVWIPGEAMSASDDRFASTERARYAALCHARKDLDSCSDAVRWNPGDPALIATLADALVRAGRVPEALRDYRRAESLEPEMRGLDAKIKATEARLNQRNKPRKVPVDRATADAASTKRYSNVDPEAQSH
jgi:cytochrome c-type biogenesis protein CcmH/NrfG